MNIPKGPRRVAAISSRPVLDFGELHKVKAEIALPIYLPQDETTPSARGRGAVLRPKQTKTHRGTTPT